MLPRAYRLPVLLIVLLIALALIRFLPRANPTSPPPATTATPTASPPPAASPARTATRFPTPTAAATTTLSPSPAPSRTLTVILTPIPSRTPALPPTPDALAQARELRLPILMYHYVEPLPPDAGPLRRGLTVTPEQFEAQLRFLHERGYHSASLYDLQYALALGAPLPPNPVIFTFDDGYAGLYTHALPLMQRHGFTGAVFLVTQFMDEGQPAYLSWSQAEALAAAGWDLEPHGKDHADLSGKSRDFLVYQILGSMQTVQAHRGGSQPRYFAYPSGQYDEAVIGILKEVGFWGAVTVEYGYNHRLRDAYRLRRVRVSGEETLADFAYRLGISGP